MSVYNYLFAEPVEEPKSFFHNHFVTFVAGAVCCAAAAFWACRRVQPQQNTKVHFQAPATLPPKPVKPARQLSGPAAATKEFRRVHAEVRAAAPSAHKHAHGPSRS